MSLKYYPLAVVAAGVSFAIIASCAGTAHAALKHSFNKSSRSAAPKPVYKRPAPAQTPRVINKTTNNTTVIRETRVVQAAPQRQSSGMFGNLAASMGGAMAGSMLGNWLSRPEPVQPQLAAPVEHAQPACDPAVYNCEKKVP